MSDVLKWLQNMANEEWEYEDGDYALEAIKFFNSLRAENGRLREALRPFADDAAKYWSDAEYTPDGSAVGVDVGDLRRARTALEGVTEPASPWRDIESAPKDGTWIFIYRDNWHGAIKAKWGEIDGVDELFTGWVFQDEFLCIGCAEGCLGYNEDIEDGYMPTHWMPLPEPPK